ETSSPLSVTAPLTARDSCERKRLGCPTGRHSPSTATVDGDPAGRTASVDRRTRCARAGSHRHRILRPPLCRRHGYVDDVYTDGLGGQSTGETQLRERDEMTR